MYQTQFNNWMLITEYEFFLDSMNGNSYCSCQLVFVVTCILEVVVAILQYISQHLQMWQQLDKTLI